MINDIFCCPALVDFLAGLFSFATMRFFDFVVRVEADCGWVWRPGSGFTLASRVTVLAPFSFVLAALFGFSDALPCPAVELGAVGAKGLAGFPSLGAAVCIDDGRRHALGELIGRRKEQKVCARLNIMYIIRHCLETNKRATEIYMSDDIELRLKKMQDALLGVAEELANLRREFRSVAGAGKEPRDATKYRLTNETIDWNGRTLRRIQALRDIPEHNVKAGDFGGYVESEKNLSQVGDAWVSDNAWIGDNAQVSGDALVDDNAQVSENAVVNGKAWVSDNAQVSGDAWVSGNARVALNEQVFFGRHGGQDLAEAQIARRGP